MLHHAAQQGLVNFSEIAVTPIIATARTAQPPFKNHGADVRTNRQHNLAGQGGQGDEMEKVICRDIFQKVVKTPLLRMDQPGPHVGEQERWERRRHPFGQFLVDKLQGSHLVLGKAVWRPEIVRPNLAFFFLCLKILTLFFDELGQIDPLIGGGFFNVDRPIQEGINFRLI